MMTKELLLSVVFNTLRLYAGAGLFDRIKEQVLRLRASNLTGPEKLKIVVDFAKSEFIGVSGALIRAIVEVVLLKQKA